MNEKLLMSLFIRVTLDRLREDAFQLLRQGSIRASTEILMENQRLLNENPKEPIEASQFKRLSIPLRSREDHERRIEAYRNHKTFQGIFGMNESEKQARYEEYNRIYHQVWDLVEEIDPSMVAGILLYVASELLTYLLPNPSEAKNMKLFLEFMQCIPKDIPPCTMPPSQTT